MVLKLVLCGDGSVGKTALRHRYLGFGFKSQYMMTIGAEFSIKDVIWQNGPLAGSSTKAQIWDLAGQQRFSAVRPLYYIGSHAALLVYDVTVSNSFENLINWLKEIKTHVGTIPVAVIGNKIDLRDFSDNPISTRMGAEFAKMVKQEFLNNTFDVPFVETSAKTGENVELAFKSLVEIVYTTYMS
jgi:small GTP-binding protein